MVSANETPATRALDHCVLPTAGLAVARRRLTALGFTVAPDAAHPFGTGNCCVFFADGSYLEPLAVIDAAAAETAIRGDNAFVARDAAFRARQGAEGFSAVVLRTADADADHARFSADGMSAGAPLSFSRPFVDAGGNRATASFKLAFAAPGADEDRFFFTCQRVNAPTVDRAALERHANRVAGIGRVLLRAAEPPRYRSFLERLCGRGAEDAAAGGLDFRLSDTMLSLMTPVGLAGFCGVDAAGRGERLQLAGIVFRVTALAALRAHLAANELPFAAHGGRLVVPPTDGQGAAFVFEEFSA